MKKHNIHTMLWLMAFLTVGLSVPTWADELLAWGSDSAGQVTALPEGTDYVSIAAGDAHGLALAADGDHIMRLAKLEGLTAHAASVAVRLGK